MTKLEQLHWRLIISMGALALIWSLMNTTGLMGGMMGGLGRIVLTVLISAAWLAIVLFFRVREPLLTLIFTGIAHGVFALILSVVILPILSGELAGPITNPFAIVAVLSTNALWGLVVGLIALGIHRFGDTRKEHLGIR
jgi:hypothetical protein